MCGSSLEAVRGNGTACLHAARRVYAIGVRDLARTFSALADPTRLEMLALLLERGELCVCDFVGSLGITQSKASRHLRYLRNAGLLDDRREGLWVHYRLSPELGATGETVVAALRDLFGERDLTELRGRLDRWTRRKSGPPGRLAAAGAGAEDGEARVRRAPRKPTRRRWTARSPAPRTPRSSRSP
jgi:ArsR family transcriptional regulator